MKKIIFWSLVMFGLTYSCANTCKAVEMPQSVIDSMNVINPFEGSAILKVHANKSYLSCIILDTSKDVYFIVVYTMNTGQLVYSKSFSDYHTALYFYNEAVEDFNLD